MSRRHALGAAAAGTAALAVGATGGAAGYAATREEPPPGLSSLGSSEVPFHGAHQAAIAHRPQAHAHLVAFDLSPRTGREALARLMRRWSRAAGRMMAGRKLRDDNQIASDAGPSSLTVLFGFGASMFAKAGLSRAKPAALEPIPPFLHDALDPALSDGDLYVEVAADDPLVAAHALRALQAEAGPDITVRWQMNGFSRSPGSTAHPMTTRNLMGQVDGTGNPQPGTKNFDRHVYVPRGGSDRSPAWMAGGSYAVVRRIRMVLDGWERLSVPQQERVVGRRKSDGAPLSGGKENSPVKLDALNPDGSLAIPGDAHVRVAMPASNQGATIIRRVFSYYDGYRDDGAPDAGLLFVAWQSDPRHGFVPIQQKLAGSDGLSRYLVHESNALFAVPGGPGEGEYVGQALLEG